MSEIALINVNIANFWNNKMESMLSSGIKRVVSIFQSLKLKLHFVLAFLSTKLQNYEYSETHGEDVSHFVLIYNRYFNNIIYETPHTNGTT